MANSEAFDFDGNVAPVTDSERQIVPDVQEESKLLVKSEGPSTYQIEESLKKSKIELNVEFPSFIELRDALERYQQENQVQLIVKDSKLLNAESTRRIIPKVYHRVNHSLMYHSITYCCKCHGELKQKLGTRIKNVGAKRLNCPMYLRFKLTTDLQRLTLFDLYDVHNHGIDPNTFQLAPRQQVYRLSRMRRRQMDKSNQSVDCGVTASKKFKTESADVHKLIAAAIKDVNSVSSLSEVDFESFSKTIQFGADRGKRDSTKLRQSQTDHSSKTLEKPDGRIEEDTQEDDEESVESQVYHENPHSPLDPESSCSDSDEEEFRADRHLLPFPVRLIGSAIQSSPELTEAAKELIEIQKANLLLEKRKLLLQTKHLELENTKLSLEVKAMEKNLANEIIPSPAHDTTIYLQA